MLQFHGNSKIYSKPSDFNRLIESLWKKNWVVYAKKPFAGPEQIIQYLSNYTHRIAISNHRLIKIENEQVYFYWRDYTDKNKTKIMKVSAHEFMRRFLIHVLPRGFTRIRQIGFLANRYKTVKLKQCQIALAFKPKQIKTESVEQIILRVYDIDIKLCKYCHKGNKKIINTFSSRYHRAKNPDTS